MNKQRKIAYLELIQSLLSCPSGEEVGVLSAHPELLDAGLVEVMRAEAERKMELGELKAADRLLNVGIKIVTANYSLSTLQKAKANHLLQQGFQQYKQSQYPQAFQSLQQSLQLYQEIGDKAGMANCWGVLGDIERNYGNWDEAERLYRQSLEVMTELGDRKGMATYCGLLGNIQRNRGNWEKAEHLYRQSLELRSELGDRSGMATSWGLLGDIQQNRGNWDEAERLYRQSLEVQTELGDKSGIAASWGLLGDIQRNRGNWNEAERLYQQSLELRTELGDRKGMASSWGQLGDIERNRGNWDEAERLYRQSLEVVQTELGARSGMATVWGRLGDIERNRGNWDEAERLYRQSLKLRTELGDRKGMASSWEVLGNIERLRGNWDEAERLYRQSLELSTKLGDRKGRASSWGVLGDIERNRGNWDEAERLYRQSLELMTELGDRKDMATSCGLLGDIEQKRGNWDEAERLYWQSLELMTELSDRKGMGTSWGLLGYIEQKRGNWDEAERLYRQSLEVQTELGDKSGIAASWGLLGDIERNRGNWDEAERLYQQSLGLRTELGDRSGMATSWGQLGSIKGKRGNWDEAEGLYRQYLEVMIELGDRSGMATSWGVLGDIERNRGNWDEAEGLYRQSLELTTKLGDRSGMASSWGRLGDIERNRDNWDEAERLYRQSLEVQTELGDRSGMATCSRVLGYIERNRGNWDEAERLFRQSLELTTKLGDRSGMGHSYNDLAFVYIHFHQIPQAITAFKAGLAVCSPGKLPVEALELGRSLGNIAFGIQDWETAIEGYEAAIEAVETLCSFTDSYAEKQKRREAEISVYEKLVQACIHAEKIGKALTSVERSKSRNLIELLVNADRQPTGEIPQEMREELDRLRREVIAKQRILESLDNPSNLNTASATDFGQRRSESPKFNPTVIETIRQQYIAAKQGLDALLDRLKSYDPNFTLTQRVEPIQFSEIQGLIDDKTALIEWYLTRDRIYVFVVTGGHGKISVWESTPTKYSELQQLRQTYLDAYFSNKSQWKTNLDGFLQRLSDILDLPQLIAGIPPDYRQLILIPYRDLHLFPLHALVLNRATEPQYLCDRFPDGIKYAPSCQFLQVSQRNQKSESQNRFFAIQNPTEDLTYADLEVEAIFPAFHPNASCLTRQQATKIALSQHPYERDFRSAEYLHFAGHGGFNFTNPMHSFLVLAGAVAGGESTTGRDTERFVSWRKGESVELEKCYTLGELFELNLPHCRLVILSACETGLIGVSPDLEEYISLGLGFLYAGATNVICSLWSVNDLSTAILMVKLYEELQIQPSISLALNQVQQWLRQVTVGNLLKWSQSSPRVSEKLRQEIQKEFELYGDEESYFENPCHWAAFCAIGI